METPFVWMCDRASGYSEMVMGSRPGSIIKKPYTDNPAFRPIRGLQVVDGFEEVAQGPFDKLS